MKVFILSILCFIFLTSCFGLNPQKLPSRFGAEPISVNTAASRSRSVSESAQCKRARRNVENAERDIARSDDDLEDAEKDLDGARDDLEDAEAELDRLEKASTLDAGAIADKEEEIQELKADEDKYENRIKREEDDIDDAEDDLRDAEREIDRHC